MAAPPSVNLVAHLQERFGLEDWQVRGALGALLVYARDRLPKTEFDALASRMPDAERIMEETKLRGVVTRPLDDLDDYEETLSNVGIAGPVAAQFAPAVLDYLSAAGYGTERDILAGALD